MLEASPWNAERAQEIVTKHAGLEGPMLPILHALQEEFGHVGESAVPLIASALNLSRAEVHGVVSFYHDFRHEPAGRRVLKLCRGEACQSMGSEALAQSLLGRLGVEWGGTTRDGELTVEPVYCLGLCASSPSALLDGEPLARLTAATLAEAIDEARGL
ncbi:formate dehydrogenase subunit gamma [Methylocapsa aurea]|uniref:formate dehydrogenase subunit gamma n=1 Tax=Methylocapsa aurea TaxID=663610 RepID=UPI0005603DF8|nr:formate dehydrogenase subunit gamma [Methylocapsa aurea]